MWSGTTPDKCSLHSCSNASSVPLPGRCTYAKIKLAQLAHGLPYRKHSSYLMERWMDFTEFFSLGVLYNLPWNKVGDEIKNDPKKKSAAKRHADRVRSMFERMWTLLRSSVLFFMRYEDGQHIEGSIMAAQRNLLRYGALAEKV